MQTPHAPGELIFKEGLSSLYRGWEAVGGKLFLTNQRLIFESHSFNFQTGATIIPLDRIARVDLAYSLVLGIPVFPNAIEVTTQDNFKFRMLVYGRNEWVQAILHFKAQGGTIEAEIVK